MAEMWTNVVWAVLRDLGARTMAILPAVLAMLTLAVAGVVVGWIASRIILRLARTVMFDARAERWGLAAAIARAGIRRPPSAMMVCNSSGVVGPTRNRAPS